MKGEKLKGIGLCRVSTIEQGKGTSLDSQEEWVRKKASAMGVELVDLIKREVSGEEFPKEIIDYILGITKKEKISYVFVYQIDRLTRGMYPGIELIKELKGRKIKIVTYSGVSDPNDGNESFMLHINMAVSELEQSTRRDRADRGIKTRLKRGEFPFKHLPFGYQRDEKMHLTLKPECKPIIKFIFDTFIQTKSYSKTQKTVNHRYKNLDISYYEIGKIIIRPIYAGDLTWGNFGKGDEKFSFPELKCIDEEIFEKAQSIIKKIRGKHERDNERIPKLIKDFINEEGFESVLETDYLLPCCPKCKNTDLQKNGHESIIGRIRTKFICKNCGHEFRFPPIRSNKRDNSFYPPKFGGKGRIDMPSNKHSYNAPTPKIPSNDLKCWIEIPD